MATVQIQKIGADGKKFWSEVSGSTATKAMSKKMNKLGASCGNFTSREDAKEFASWLVANCESVGFGRATGEFDISGF